MASRCFRCGARSDSAYCTVCSSGLKQVAGPPTQAMMPRLLADVQSVEEKAADIRFGRGGTRWSAGIGSTEYDYRASVGDSRGNAMVMACARWACRTFPEAPTIVETRAPKGWTPSDEHPLLSLLARPNPYYSGLHLWSATLADWMLTGNAYWVKRRTAQGRPVELWWVPSSMLEPGWPDDGLTFIGWYEYKVEGQAYRIDPADVVHFRDGFDPANIRKGLSPLAALLREVATDNEAANWTASMLRNVGVPSVVLSPEGEYEIDQDAAEEARDRWVAKTIGDRRGGPIFMSGRTKVSVLSFSPEQMQMRELRRIPEERVSAIFGTPAVVVGLGAGLDRSCVPSYARVQTPSGTKTIAEIEPGSVVWSFKDGQIVPRLVEHKWAKGRDMVYEVRTANRRIRATDNHPFMVRVPGRMGGGGNATRQPSYEWRDLGDLKVGDHIIQAKSYPDQGGTMLPDGRTATPGMLQFLGAIIGDGTVSPGVGVRIAMPPTDRCVTHYEGLAASLFTKYMSGGERPWKRSADGLTDQIVERVDAGESYHGIGKSLDMNNATVRSRYLSATVVKPVVTETVMIQRRERDFGFASAQASRDLAVLGVSGRAHTKRVPAWVFGLSRELRLAFLAGIVDTDGSVDKRGALSITFCNRPLLEDVRDLCISTGIRCCNVGYRRISPDRLPNPGIQEFYEAWTFTASSARHVAEIPFADPLYRERVDANQHRHRGEGFDAHKAGLSADLGFAEIKSITAIGEDDVYDLTVEDGHSFFCENTLISNTYANMEEAREAAYESFLIPTQRLMAAELNGQLVPDFGDINRLRVGFDLSKVRVLQDDQNALHERARGDLAGGLIKLNEAREMVGQDPLPGKDGDIFYIPGTVMPTEATELLTKPEPVVMPVVPPTDQEEPDDQPPPADSNPAKALELKDGTVLPVPEDDVEIGPDDARVALALMNEIFPQYRGLLDADVVGTNGRNGHG